MEVKNVIIIDDIGIMLLAVAVDEGIAMFIMEFSQQGP